MVWEQSEIEMKWVLYTYISGGMGGGCVFIHRIILCRSIYLSTEHTIFGWIGLVWCYLMGSFLQQPLLLNSTEHSLQIQHPIGITYETTTTKKKRIQQNDQMVTRRESKEADHIESILWRKWRSFFVYFNNNKKKRRVGHKNHGLHGTHIRL